MLGAMNDAQEPNVTRSPGLMSRRDTGLLVIDVQEKLIPLLPRRERIVWNIGRLLDGAAILGVPAAGTEQYPKGLGPLVPEVRGRLTNVPEKMAFSCAGCTALFERIFAERDKLLVCGIETHVCVQQTVLDLLGAGIAVYVAVDAVGARFEIDHEVALKRMDAAGAVLTTTEAAIFELCETAAAPEFKQLSQLIRQAGPGERGA
jgi:nicotinamidase-related amidase